MRTREECDAAQVLEILLPGNPVTVSALAAQLGLTDKQVRTRLRQAGDLLEVNGWGEIASKPRVGSWLESDEPHLADIRSFVREFGSQTVIPLSQRESHVLFRLFSLKKREGLSPGRLAEELYVSQPTLTRLMNSVGQQLETWNISLLNDRRAGYILQYEENDYRKAVSQFFLGTVQDQERERLLGQFFQGLDLAWLRRIIVRQEHEWHLHFSDQVFLEVLLVLALAIQRQDHPVTVRTEDARMLERYNDYLFAKAICQEAGQMFGVVFSEEEICFLTMRIMCAGFVRISQPDQIQETWDVIREYDSNLLAFVDEVLSSMAAILDCALDTDQNLRNSLILHLRSTVFRLRHGQRRSNELLQYIKTEYSRVYTASWIISMLFEKYFDLQITDDELGYIVLLIQSALERRNTEYNAVILADFARSFGELVSQRIIRYIPEIRRIDILSRYETDNPHYREADLIITRTSCNDPREVIIDNLLSEQGVAELKAQIRRKEKSAASQSPAFSVECASLFSPDLIFLQQKFSDKETLLKFATTWLEEKGYCSSGLYQSALNREKLTSTSIGGSVAFPHGDPEFVNESHVALMTLTEPMLWDGEEKVDVVFFAAFNMNSREERHRIETFYKELIPCMADGRFMKLLRSSRDSISLYKELFR